LAAKITVPSQTTTFLTETSKTFPLLLQKTMLESVLIENSDENFYVVMERASLGSLLCPVHPEHEICPAYVGLEPWTLPSANKTCAWLVIQR
jgi:hypothetical protein